MALPFEVESLDSIDESARAFYTETEDKKFRLDLDGYEDPKGLKSALDKERQAARDASKLAKDLQKKYEGIDPDKVKNLLSKLENDEEAKLLADGKIDEVVNRRIEKQRNDYDKQLTEAQKQAEIEAGKAKKFEQRVLDNHIRAAAAKAGIHQHAIEDALFRARTMFHLDDDGNAVQIDQDGQVVFGKDGKSPFSPSEWLDEMKEKAPHWFPAANSGGGAVGNTSNRGSKQDLSALPPRERLMAARRQT